MHLLICFGLEKRKKENREARKKKIKRESLFTAFPFFLPRSHTHTTGRVILVTLQVSLNIVVARKVLTLFP